MNIEDREVEDSRSFSPKMGWLAIKTDDTEGLEKELELSSVRRIDYDEAIEDVYEHINLEKLSVVGSKLDCIDNIIITPPVEGWTFVISDIFLVLSEEINIEKFENTLKKLSQKFGEIQAFATHRVVESHVWILAKDGAIERSFAYSGDTGEVYSNKSTITPGEEFYRGNIERIAKVWNEESPNEEEYFAPDEETVFEVAKNWSLDPRSLSKMLQQECLIGKSESLMLIPIDNEDITIVEEITNGEIIQASKDRVITPFVYLILAILMFLIALAVWFTYFG